MPRDRKNPFKTISYRFEPKETTVVLLTCIPTDQGYYENRFEVLKLCLSSIFKHTDLPYDLLVFDNGSLPSVKDFLKTLHTEGKIQYLFMSQSNIGYGAALNMAFAAAPGKYIAYTDDDIFFYPNWLSHHLDVLKTFPKVGLVSGQVVEGDSVSVKALEEWTRSEKIPCEPFSIPFEWTERWYHSLGLDPQLCAQRSREKNLTTYLISYKGLKVFSGARGYAYAFKKELLKSLPPLATNRLVGGSDALWHEQIAALGYFRLCTYKRLTDHIGNRVDDFWKNEAERFGIRVEKSVEDKFRVDLEKADGFYKRALRSVMTQCVRRL